MHLWFKHSFCRAHRKTLETRFLKDKKKDVRKVFQPNAAMCESQSHSLSHLCVHSSVQHGCGCEKKQKNKSGKRLKNGEKHTQAEWIAEDGGCRFGWCMPSLSEKQSDNLINELIATLCLFSSHRHSNTEVSIYPCRWDPLPRNISSRS